MRYIRCQFIKRPIILYFYRAKSGFKNFGDEVSYFVVKKSLGRVILQARSNMRLKIIYENHFHLSSLLIQKKLREYNRLFAVGSILGPKVRKNDVIWGSGFISIDETLSPDVNQLNVLAVRGQKTINKLKELNVTIQDKITFGDPGLLISKYIPPSISTTEKIVIVPHYAHKKRFDELTIVSKKAYQVVNARDDYRSIAKKISGASLVLSSSLHGIIFAHAYSIPAIRLIFQGSPLKGGDFKFDDYLSIYEDRIVLPSIVINNNQEAINLDEILKVYSPIPPAREMITRFQDSLISVLNEYYHG